MTPKPPVEQPVAEPTSAAMATALRVATVATFALALAGLLPGQAGMFAGGAAIGIVVVVPLLRVGWLAVRWFRRGDLRFAAIAVALLVIVLSGAAAAVAS